jgi:dUTP pyrophosphatase
LVYIHARIFYSKQNRMSLKVNVLSDLARVPQRGSEGAVGYDLFSAEEKMIAPRARVMIHTDIAMELPINCYGRIAPRSGLAWNHGIDVGGGVIDPDYRGNVKVILFNHSNVEFKVNIGDRIAQLILEQVVVVPVEVSTSLSNTVRGNQGIGSTGIVALTH